MRRSIKEPIPEIFEAYDELSRGVEAHLAGNRAQAETFFRKADSRVVWHWTNPAWSRPDLNVCVKRPTGDTQWVPLANRDPLRYATNETKSYVLERDGYRCRYCGIPVVDAEIRKIAHRLYPAAVPWISQDVDHEHAAFQCLWMQYDHVVPHSHGGSSQEDNIVVCCALCNFGKDKYTLLQLGLVDPRLTPPVPSTWDGLERLRAVAPLKKTNASVIKAIATPVQNITPATGAGSQQAFFLPGSWVSAGYLYTPPINGKERWFKLGPQVSAEPAVRSGIKGCILICDPKLLLRRGISPNPHFDLANDSRSTYVSAGKVPLPPWHRSITPTR